MVSGLDELSIQLCSDFMGIISSREENNITDVPSEDADLRAVEISNVS